MSLLEGSKLNDNSQGYLHGEQYWQLYFIGSQKVWATYNTKFKEIKKEIERLDKRN
jgi:hypothetical protein